MSHLYPHKHKGWQVIYRVHFRDGSSKKKTRYSKNKQTAQLILREATGLEDLSRQGTMTREEIVFYLNRGYLSREEAEQVSSGRLPVSKPWDELLREYEVWSRRSCKPTTHAENVIRVGNLIERLKHFDPAEITEEHIRRYVIERTTAGGRQVSAATARKEVSDLRRLLDQISPDNAARAMTLPAVRDKKHPRILAPNEIIAFLKGLRARRSYLRGYIVPLTLTYLYAGLRPSELVRLEPADVSLHAGKIYVHGGTKTDEPRSVDISPRLLVHLEACLRKGGKYLFGGDESIHPNSVGREIRRTMRSAGLEDTKPYSLRHSFASYLLSTSGDLRYVMDQAGHRRISTTQGYLHTVPSEEAPMRRMTFRGTRKKPKT